MTATLDVPKWLGCGQAVLAGIIQRAVVDDDLAMPHGMTNQTGQIISYVSDCCNASRHHSITSNHYTCGVLVVKLCTCMRSHVPQAGGCWC